MLVAILVLALAACSSDEEAPAVTQPDTEEQTVAEQPTEQPVAEEPTEEPVAELFGDSIRGGLLYDKWWKPLGLDAPEADHPLWATQDTNTRSGADTWRCKECHGWDYQGADGAYADGSSHFTGFTGVIQWSGGSANDILATLQGSTSADHDFSEVMDEQALVDMALFISEEILDTSSLVDADKSAVGGDLAIGVSLFGDTCAECHGPEGLAINFKSNVAGPEYISGLSGGNPWEFLHKMRFGQPGVPDMAQAVDIGWSVEEQISVLAYAQSLPEESFVTQGGQLDYRGAEGAYADGSSHFTGFAGILGASSQSAEELTAWLDGTTNEDHDFSAYLDEAAVNMLVTFMQEGTVDMTQFIGDDKVASGDVANGEALYGQGCARCHGDAGNAINFGDDSDPEYLGSLANGNPWETVHKAANGQPAEHMTIGLNMGWSWEDLADLLSYIQTLGE
jgi:thiosulfate dehydrogenase